MIFTHHFSLVILIVRMQCVMKMLDIFHFRKLLNIKAFFFCVTVFTVMFTSLWPLSKPVWSVTASLDQPNGDLELLWCLPCVVLLSPLSV